VTESSRTLTVALLSLGLCVCVGAILVLTGRLATPVAPPPAEQAREVAPDFELKDMRGQTVRLSALRGQVVLVDFWATWCGPCREELPMIVRLVQRNEARGVRLVAISEDDPPAQEPDVAAFAQKVPGLDRHVVYGNPEVERLFGVDSLPTLFVLDRNGGLVDALVGSRSEAEVSALIEEALGPQ
jgi:thiol-disulfide isomerase/thioredoxin